MKVTVANTSDSLFWYSKNIGKSYDVFRVEHDRVWVRTESGYSNFILMCDLTIEDKMEETVENNYDREEVQQFLASGVSKIAFYKIDGTLREMNVTLDATLIPAEKQPRADAKSTKSSTTVPVFDVDAGSWKSFLFENLVTIEK